MFILTIVESSPWVPPNPKQSLERHDTAGMPTAYMAVNSDCTSGIDLVSHTVPTGLLCKIFVEIHVVEELATLKTKLY